jgi:large subunit ribosomal protein L6
MSRIGKKPITIPTGVTVSFDNDFVKVTGPLGFLEAKLRPEIGHSIRFRVAI